MPSSWRAELTATLFCQKDWTGECRQKYSPHSSTQGLRFDSETVADQTQKISLIMSFLSLYHEGKKIGTDPLKTGTYRIQRLTS
jgi:hypothetical protein